MELELGYVTQKISVTRQVECNPLVGQIRKATTTTTTTQKKEKKKKERTPVICFGQVSFCRYLTLFYHKEEQFCTEIIVPNFPCLRFAFVSLALFRSPLKGREVHVVTSIILVRLALLHCVSRAHEIETDLSCIRPSVVRPSVVRVAIISVPNAWVSFKF